MTTRVRLRIKLKFSFSTSMSSTLPNCVNRMTLDIQKQWFEKSLEGIMRPWRSYLFLNEEIRGDVFPASLYISVLFEFSVSIPCC